MSSDVDRLPGECPKCEGDAWVYPFPNAEDEGHIYCQEENECGWVHRHKKGIWRFVDEEANRNGPGAQTEDT